ncbi:tRNA (guanine-N(7)-)-methyltransferase non-catalytic subunit wdr4-like isoform X1 [Anneissia japonica]|uniref:tRNA (guanine-N(7)-)-methyltransferase non-catalytic subunit wdr4-like isoform X1 n=1 Tax=Anneissia japonica TaxID=1529436 RepID=UPI00142556C6|nr:tRNA (guanine-N(7)-)-methyltransferase non-catalytic subunit wdr4-like isoform X1 [Anneissia japonica]
MARFELSPCCIHLVCTSLNKIFAYSLINAQERKCFECVENKASLPASSKKHSRNGQQDTENKCESTRDDDPSKKEETEAADRTKVGAEKLNEAKSKEDSGGNESENDGHSCSGNVLAHSFSPSSRYYAVCDDFKQLSIFDTTNWSKLSVRSVRKRSTSLAFNHAEDCVYVGDKSGDVYRFSVKNEEDEGTLVLGHVSMLLDLAISPDDKYIVTADRDEKIRVSHLPNCYNIHCFCLGHTDLVSKIAILPKDQDILVSGSGDASLRFWKYTTGQELCRLSLKQMEDSARPTVLCIRCSKKSNYVAVLLEKFMGVQIYEYDRVDEVLDARLVASIETGVEPWDIAFDEEDHLWVFKPKQDELISVYEFYLQDKILKLKLTNLNEGNQILNVIGQVNTDWQIFKESLKVESLYTNLHKKSQDNSKDWQRRKERKIKGKLQEMSEQTEGSACKKIKVDEVLSKTTEREEDVQS